MDPLADKLLTTVALIYLCLHGMCHEVVICIVLAREFAVSGIRLIAAANPAGGKVIAAGMMGKAKTVLQMVASMLGLLAMALLSMGTIPQATYDMMAMVTNILMWAMAVLTVVSGMQYIVPNFDLIKNAK
jgi:CDP-diacylglycerol--glycerol-3-phosphate 3-phosphatidyltransferase